MPYSLVNLISKTACSEAYARDEPTFFYVIHNTQNGLCKIGHTSDLWARVSTLSKACGRPLTLLYYAVSEPEIDIPSREIERLCHVFFNPKRVMGEWFRLDRRDLVMLRNVIHCDDFFSGGLFDFLHERKYL